MKILLIEDDLDLGAALQRALDPAHLPSVWVRRLADGMAQLQANDLDCVLLDINLPDGEGFSLLEHLRRTNNAVPVLVMTARDALDDRLRALKRRRGRLRDQTLFGAGADRPHPRRHSTLCGPSCQRLAKWAHWPLTRSSKRCRSAAAHCP